MLAARAPAILLAQLFVWLGISFAGYVLLLWPFEPMGLGSAFTGAGSAMFTLGFSEPRGGVPSAIVFVAAVTGLMTIALQIAYLPTLYAAFNRRETEVALLNARAGVPSWGPELLARTHYALGSGSRPSTRCPTCTPSGNAGPPTSQKATPATCRWCASARPGRCRPG